MSLLLRPVCLLVLLLPLAAQARDERPAWFLGLTRDNKVEVLALEAANRAALEQRAGLLLWGEEDGSERWAVVKKGWSMPRPGERPAAELPVGGVTRGSGGAPAAAGIAGLTRQLAPLQSGVVARGVLGGDLLTAWPTFYRFANKEGQFPAERLKLQAKQGGLKVPLGFKAGQQKLALKDVPNLPAAIAKAGLPPGDYTIPTPLGVVALRVVDEQTRKGLRAPLDEMARLVGGTRGSLLLLFTVEHLLESRELADGDKVGPFSIDAIDAIDRAPESSRTPHLIAQRQRLLEPAAKAAKEAPITGAQPTNIPELDAALREIAAARWARAEKLLEAPALLARGKKDKRTRALTMLYQGVVLGELGPAREGEAKQALADALKGLEGGEAGDLFRAAFNAASLHHQLAENRLYNHAFLMATGSRTPLVALLGDWSAARRYYERAGAAADKAANGAGSRAAVKIAQARLGALLADVLETLGGQPEAEKAARADAAARAGEVAKDKSLSPLDRAQAHELTAHLAFRADRLADARAAAGEAEKHYLLAGRLASLENVYRLLGLADAREAERSTRGAAARADALRHLRIAHRLAELLRERVPTSNAGTSRAGFMARKAFVTDKMAELLLESGRAADVAEALGYIELGKARSLQDVQRAARDRAGHAAPDTARLLAAWPKDVVALEYFLGPRSCWLVVVSAAGKPQAFRLKGARGEPVAPRELVAEVQRFLRDLDGYKDRMLKGLMNDKGFEKGWQDDLHRLFGLLVPAGAFTEMKKAELVVIVPQHILHYLPFSALVTKRDEAKRGKVEMVKPSFLIEEKFTLVQAPSLATWRPARGKARIAKQVTAVGLSEAPGADPLPGVKIDLENVQAVFGKSVTMLEGERVREPAVKGALNKPGLLFIGTHGINQPDQPLESFLLLLAGGAPGEEGPAQDGKLTAAEIFAARVRADLVVLSACYSGLGDRSPLPGDDLFGLQRAFLAGGAATVVSGLWDVYDETAPVLMKGMFERLVKGEGIARALTETQRDFVTRHKASTKVEPYIHPYFWAVYTACGDDRTRWGK